MNKKKDVLVFIKHILNNINDIEKFSKDVSEEKFKKDSMRQKAIIKSLEIIGEATKNIPLEIKRKYPLIPWKDVVGMRDKLIHHYFGVDLITIWKVVKENLPDLKEKILKIKKDLELRNKK